MSVKRIQILVLSFILLPVLTVTGAEHTGLQIMEKVYNRDDGNDIRGNLTMTLINSHGNKRVRKIKQFTKDFGKVEKSIMFFISPADVRNTSFMNWSYVEEGKDDDQWIYLPALKRVKRISSDSKSDYFMGSDFTYDDLGDRHPNEDNHRLLREENFKGEDCYVVESKTKDEEYMYSRTVTWIIKDKWIGLKREFYDEDGELLKILKIRKHEKISGFWTILDSEMYNVQKKHSTLMELSDMMINTGIPARQFTERMMKRGL